MTSNLLPDTLDLLKTLLRIPSLSGEESHAADYLQQKLEGWFPGQVRRMGQSLVVEGAGEAPGPTLLLCSHIDTVAPSAGWTREPFAATEEGDKIYGLGANDAGASVVSLIAAARQIGKPKAGRWILALVAEEEKGTQGFCRIEPLLPRYDAALFGEPTGMGVATSMRGAMRAVLRSRGMACHASRPWEGQNAADAFAKDLAVLRMLDLKDNSPWGGATLEPTILRGGDSPNQIPALVETTLDIRTTATKNNDWVEAAFKKTGLDIEITANRRRPMFNDPDAPLLKAIRAACPKIKDYTFNGSCDMAFATAPSVVLGPGQSDRSHAADEYIKVPELEEAVRNYAAIINLFLST